MRRIPLVVFAALVLSGCAKPMFDITEPDESQRAEAGAVLDTTRLVPVLPVTVGTWERLDRVLGPVRSAAVKVCRDMNLSKTETGNGFAGDLQCIDALLSDVTLYMQERSINAYADEHNDIGVFAGLLMAMGTDAELAAVLAHEFSHVMLGHVEKKKANALAGMAIATGLAGAFAASTRANPQSFGESWQRAGALAGSRAYSPEMEIEADRLAVYILEEAGYPPTAMRDVIVRMHRIVPERRRGAFSPKRVEFLDTHPSNDRRIAHILSAIRDAKAGVPLRIRKR